VLSVANHKINSSGDISLQCLREIEELKEIWALRNLQSKNCNLQ